MMKFGKSMMALALVAMASALPGFAEMQEVVKQMEKGTLPDELRKFIPEDVLKQLANAMETPEVHQALQDFEVKMKDPKFQEVMKEMEKNMTETIENPEFQEGMKKTLKQMEMVTQTLDNVNDKEKLQKVVGKFVEKFQSMNDVDPAQINNMLTSAIGELDEADQKVLKPLGEMLLGQFASQLKESK